MSEMTNEAIVRDALQRAFLLGQDYWRQGDSDSYRQNALADQTKGKFDELVSATVYRIREVPHG